MALNYDPVQYVCVAWRMLSFLCHTIDTDIHLEDGRPRYDFCIVVAV